MELKLRQHEAAKQCGVTASVYSRWLAERTTPSMKNLEGVARFLDMTLPELFGSLPASYRARYQGVDELVRQLQEDVTLLRAQLNELTGRMNDLSDGLEQLLP